MKLSLSVLATALFSGALAAPSKDPRHDIQTAHFIFHGVESGSYHLTVKADGNVTKIYNELPINTIEINDYDANSQCVFKGLDGTKIESKLHIDTETGDQSLILPEGTPIASVSCQGFCVYNYAACYSNGQMVGPCCNGLCAANLCRPWNGV
ncbi:hypothetical protein GMORB2_3615 [Geosmithia morbida]|uniref:SSCRP protein n=1 Tax=Geosmithia morbida TaxID=1094350 RepID=A0A9P5CYZ9_9HYPO|nr:uncharacterized protein GMORB2_3615 [Geosmithia morbida]KAF4119927.1 hypothetical protein GMORB2_3615 [Geosmithia morbida]